MDIFALPPVRRRRPGPTSLGGVAREIQILERTSRRVDRQSHSLPRIADLCVMRVVCTYPFERTRLTCGPGCPCHSWPWLCRHMSCGSQPCSRQWNRLGFSSTVFPWKWGSERAQEQGRRSSTFPPTVIFLHSRLRSVVPAHPGQWG